MNESLLSFAQAHALLLESAALAAPKRHLMDKEMSGSQKIRCQPGILPQLTATKCSDDGKRQLPAPLSPQSMLIANLFPALDQLHLQFKPAHQLSLTIRELHCLPKYSNDEQFLSVPTCLILL